MNLVILRERKKRRNFRNFLYLPKEERIQEGNWRLVAIIGNHTLLISNFANPLKSIQWELCPCRSNLTKTQQIWSPYVNIKKKEKKTRNT